MSPWTKSERWHRAAPLETFAFEDAANPLRKLPPSPQVLYLLKYLTGLKCSSVLCEPNYFDRDYLSEFSEFYSRSSRGYSNSCSRLHYFRDGPLSREEFIASLEDDKAFETIKARHIGFSVIRPLPSAPLGRTILSWFPDTTPEAPRITTKRIYDSHIAGRTLSVTGLAWQQQDTAVGACATVALWSALHSASFDEHHSVPTTTEITRLAEQFGTRTFPSTGLGISQLAEAVKALELAPMLEVGERGEFFSAQRFNAICTSFIRSGYPLILGGCFENGSRHAVCVTGFRESPVGTVGADMPLRDGKTSTYYIHDDNLGPNVRFELTEEKVGGLEEPVAILRARPPDGKKYGTDGIADPTEKYSIVPTFVLVPVHNEVQNRMGTFLMEGHSLREVLEKLHNAVAPALLGKTETYLFHFGANFYKLSHYTDEVLKFTLAGARAGILSKTRAALWESVPPMSKFIGVVRIWRNNAPIIDVLYDTSDSDRQVPAYCIVSHDQLVTEIFKLTKAFPSVLKIEAH